MSISYWNRKQRQLEEEEVYGDFFVSLLYGSKLSYSLTTKLLTGKALSKLYGSIQSSSLSKKKVKPFVEKFKIPMHLYEEGPFENFNQFFIRKFREGKRPYPSDLAQMGAPAEARYLAFADADEAKTNIKGIDLNPLELLHGAPQKELFKGGPCLLARLCPVDYHRFHFPDSGRTVHFHREAGGLHSVNPLALGQNAKILLENERHISILATEHFGLLAYVEVGALCVGKIHQSHSMERPFSRGSEKGYFLFGASTVVVVGEKGRWLPSTDILEKTRQGIECLVELGEPLAEKIP